MANKFQFKLLTGIDAQQKYDRIKDQGTHPYTFYLLENGVGYLGNTPLFGGDTKNILIKNTNFGNVSSNEEAIIKNVLYFITSDITITDSTGTIDAKKGSIFVADATGQTVTELSKEIFSTYMADYVTNKAIKSTNIMNNDGTHVDPTKLDKEELITAKAVKEFVQSTMTSQSVLDIAFFNDVSNTKTVTKEDIQANQIDLVFKNNGTVTVSLKDLNDVHENDVIFAFAVTTNNNTQYVPVNLHSLIDNYEGGTCDTTTVSVVDSTNGKNHTKEIKVEVNKSTIDDSVINAAIEKAITDSYTGDTLDENKFISEKQLATILANVLKNFVQYSEE